MIWIGFTSSLAQFGSWASVQGPGARLGAQELGSGPRCSVQGPGARFGAQLAPGQADSSGEVVLLTEAFGEEAFGGKKQKNKNKIKK